MFPLATVYLSHSVSLQVPLFAIFLRSSHLRTNAASRSVSEAKKPAILISGRWKRTLGREKQTGNSSSTLSGRHRQTQPSLVARAFSLSHSIRLFTSKQNSIVHCYTYIQIDKAPHKKNWKFFSSSRNSKQ